MVSPLTALLLCAPAEAAMRYTFCVAGAPEGRDVWITDVFAASEDRDRLEADLRAVFAKQGRAVVAQCPLPSEDKTEVVNAQTIAEDFNRKLGKSLHALGLTEAAARR